MPQADARVDGVAPRHPPLPAEGTLLNSARATGLLFAADGSDGAVRIVASALVAMRAMTAGRSG